MREHASQFHPRLPFTARLLLILLASVLLQTAQVVTQQPNRGDNALFEQWALAIHANGLGQIYAQQQLRLNYPPVYLYVLAVDGAIYGSRASTSVPPSGVFGGRGFGTRVDSGFIVLQKLNPMLALLAGALLIGLASRRYCGDALALTGAAMYGLSPALMYVSAVWGQVDALPLLFMLAAFYAGLYRRPVLAGSMLALAVLTKAQMVLFVPFLLVFLMAQCPLKRARRPHSLARVVSLFLSRRATMWGLKIGAGLAATTLMVIAPFLLGGSGSSILEPYTGAVGYFPRVSLNAFNAWWLAFGGSADTMNDTQPLLAGLSPRTIGLWVLCIVLVATAAYFLYATLRAVADDRRPESTRSVPSPAVAVYPFALACTVASLAFFLLPTESHERYSLYSLAPLALATIFRPGARPRDALLAVLLSLLMMFNLVYANEPASPAAFGGDFLARTPDFFSEVIGRALAGAMLAAGALAIIVTIRSRGGAFSASVGISGTLASGEEQQAQEALDVSQVDKGALSA